MDNAELLRSAAGQIDELDIAISHLNEDKKAVYQSVKDTVSRAEYRAWREAVKPRQKRRTDREKMDEHDSLVADMLHILEQTGMVHAIARVQVREAPHNPETGEIIETSSAAAPAVAVADEEGGVASVAPPSAHTGPGDMPPFLKRGKAKSQAEEAASW